MSRLEIKLMGDPILRQVAKKVPKVTKRIVKLLKDMEDTMYVADGVGLAAPQVGVSERIIVVDVGDGPLHLVNPEVVATEGRAVDKEGCLSIPGVNGYVERPARVTVVGLDPRGKERKIEASGYLARVLQHEIDHLNGILFVDMATGVRSFDEPGDR